MKFTLEIELGDDAMRTPWDVAVALSSAVMALQDNSRNLADGENGILRDFYGNTVGGWGVKCDLCAASNAEKQKSKQSA
jgi:hypothetical protein